MVETATNNSEALIKAANNERNHETLAISRNDLGKRSRCHKGWFNCLHISKHE